MKKQSFNLKGVKPSPFDERDLNFHLTRFVSFKTELPVSFSAEHNGIRNQERYSSCVGFASASALEVANGAVEIKPEEPDNEIYFRSYVVDKRGIKIMKKVFVLIDGFQSYYSEFPGVVACKVIKDIVAKGPVEVKVWVDGYKVKTYSGINAINFLNKDESRRTTLYVGAEPQPQAESFFNPHIEPEEKPLPDEDIIPDNVPPEILPKKKNLFYVLLELLKEFLKIINEEPEKPFIVNAKNYLKLFSPKYIYSECKRINGNFKDTGTFPKNACSVLKDLGCVLEHQCQYNEPIPEDLSKGTKKYLEGLARENKIESYHRLYTPEEVQRALFNGQGVFFALRDASLLVGHKSIDFPKYKKLRGWSAHAMCFVGWDKKGILVKNSWGSRWGRNGYSRIPFESDWWEKGIFEIHSLKIKRN